MTTGILANLGCGPRGGGRVPSMFGAWREVRVDANPDVAPDIVADLTDLSAIPSGAVQAVWLSHALEHLYRHDGARALAEIFRILSDDGFACVIVPDLQAIGEHIVADRLYEPLYQSNAGPISAHDVVFGFGEDIARGNDFMAHRSGFTPSAMTQALRAAQFAQFVIRRRPGFELAAVAHKTGWQNDAAREGLMQQLGL